MFKNKFHVDSFNSNMSKAYSSEISIEIKQALLDYFLDYKSTVISNKSQCPVCVDDVLKFLQNSLYKSKEIVNTNWNNRIAKYVIAPLFVTVVGGCILHYLFDVTV